MEQEYYSARQVSEHFGVSLRTVRRWIASGRLPAYKLGTLVRIKRSDIEAFERILRSKAVNWKEGEL